jgi:hypothetical protein
MRDRGTAGASETEILERFPPLGDFARTAVHAIAMIRIRTSVMMRKEKMT